MPKKNNIPNDTLDVTELDQLNPEKQTRFQVKRVKTDSENDNNVHIRIKMDAEVQTDDEEDNDLHSVTDRTRLSTGYARSFR